jgi:serine/threonine protein kinase
MCVPQMLKYDPKERISAKEALQHDFFRMGAAARVLPNGRARPEEKDASTTTAEPAEAAVQGLGGSGSGLPPLDHPDAAHTALLVSTSLIRRRGSHHLASACPIRQPDPAGARGPSCMPW